MRVLFLCGVFAKENEDEVIAQAKKSVEFSANQMQLKLIHGFNMVADTQVISAPFLGHYPNQSRSPYFYGFANAQTLCKYVHFNNIWGYRNLSRAHSLKKAVRSFAFAEDDEKLIVKGLRFSLEQDDMEVDCAYDGEEALEMAKKTEYDIVLLDVMLPKMDGFEVCQRIREFSNMPIIMLTAKGDDMDKILGLEYGADDYITKPFNILEVKARIKAIMRRSSKRATEDEKKKIFEKNGLKIDCDSRRVFVEDKEVKLTAKEYDLLELLSFHPNKVYSRENLLNIVWGYDYPGDVRTVDVHIRRLREKIETNPSDPKYVYTKWGVGYYFRG